MSPRAAARRASPRSPSCAGIGQLAGATLRGLQRHDGDPGHDVGQGRLPRDALVVGAGTCATPPAAARDERLRRRGVHRHDDDDVELGDDLVDRPLPHAST